MRFLLPALMSAALLSAPALAQQANPANPAGTSQSGGMETPSQTTPDANGNAGTMGSMGATMAPNPNNCGTPDEFKPCRGSGGQVRPAAARP